MKEPIPQLPRRRLNAEMRFRRKPRRIIPIAKKLQPKLTRQSRNKILIRIRLRPAQLVIEVNNRKDNPQLAPPTPAAAATARPNQSRRRLLRRRDPRSAATPAVECEKARAGRGNARKYGTLGNQKESWSNQLHIGVTKLWRTT